MKKYLPFIFALSLALGVNIYFRLFPVNFPQLKIQAKEEVEDKLHEDIAERINKAMPDFHALAREKLIAREFSDYKLKNKAELAREINQKYLELKDDFQDSNHQTYLSELDCWHWARYTDNVCRLGGPGDKVVSGRQIDTLMSSPSGEYLLWSNFLFYFSAGSYKIFSFVFKGVPLFTFLFYLPLFLIAVFIILIFIFCFNRWGALAAVLACFYIGLTPIFLARSSVGWFDTDILNLLFPFLVVWTYVKAYTKSSLKLKVLWLCFSAFWLGLFCFNWTHWWFILAVIIVYELYSLVALLVFYFFKTINGPISFKERFISLFLFLAFGVFWIIIYSGFAPLRALYVHIKSALVLNNYLTDSIWPNVYFTVSELQKINFNQMINEAGGVILFVLPLACLVMLFFRTLRDYKRSGFERELVVILVIWFVSMFFACFKGIRFVMFLLIPLGICFGWVIAEAYHFFRKKNIWVIFIILMSSFILCGELANNAKSEVEGIFPLMDDAWFEALEGIKYKTTENTVVNSWWDFGDWFKAVVHRPVVFDGQSQNTPVAYWMANVLITDNEKEAVSILRMLNNGGNRAFEIIDQSIEEPFVSVLLLKKIILLEPEKAKKVLLEFLPLTKAEEVVKLVFDRPGDASFVVDYTMLDKMGTISFLGTWDFMKVYLSKNLGKKDEVLSYLVRLGLSKEAAEKLYREACIIAPQDLTPWVSRRINFHSKILNGKVSGGIVLFGRGLVYDLKEKKVYLYSEGKKDYKIPKYYFIFDNGKFEEIHSVEGDADLSVLVFKENNDWRAVLLDDELAKSIFVRLYFLKGSSLKHFSPLLDVDDNDNHISVFKINWGENGR